jgi:3-deoxy-D-manno-octulosonic-acid transferase
MMLLIYSVLLRFAAPWVWIWMYLRARRAGGDWEILGAERFGRYPQPWDGQAPVWVHAVSLGETRTAQSLIKALVDRGERVLLTHMTATGRAEGARLFASEIANGQVLQQWVPYDFFTATQRFFKHYRPRLGLLIEREVWPNLINQAHRQGIGMVLVNARFSEKAKGHVVQISRVFGSLLQEAYSSLDLALAQTEADAARLFDVGVRHVQALGNLKFDIALPEVAVKAGKVWRAQLDRPVVAIASTREGEDAWFVQGLRQILDGYATPSQANAMLLASAQPPLFFLIPRHPQRFDEAAGYLDRAGLCYARWSQLGKGGMTPSQSAALQVILGDTVGEMPFFYAASDVAIVAGSFAPWGGQNLIEACAVGVPVIVGPHTRNFAQAVEDAAAKRVLVQIHAPLAQQQAVDAALKQALDWLEQPETLRRLGSDAKAWVAQHTGATQRTLEQLREFEADRTKFSMPQH